MNTGAFGEGFPYSNFHDLNMDWIIKIAKDFLDQYTHIQQVIADGETSLQNLTTEGLQQLQDKADALEELLQAWYNEHSEDIANQLASALADLNTWYTTHQNYLDQTLATNIQAFNDSADAKARQTIASIPADYTALSNMVHDLFNAIDPVYMQKVQNNEVLLPLHVLNGDRIHVKRVDGEVFGSDYIRFYDYDQNYINQWSLGEGYGRERTINYDRPEAYYVGVVQTETTPDIVYLVTDISNPYYVKLTEIMTALNNSITDSERKYAQKTVLNRFNKNTITTGKYVDPTNGTLSDNEDFFASDYIYIADIDEITMSYSHIFGWYDANYQWIGHPDNMNTGPEDRTYERPQNAVYLRFSAYNTNLNRAQAGYDISRFAYVPFSTFIMPELQIMPSNIDDDTVIVDLNGAGHFRSFTEAIYETVDSGRPVYVRPGYYNIVNEYINLFGQENVDTMADADTEVFHGFQFGIILRNRKITFAPGAKLICNWSRHLVDATHRFSPIRVDYDVEINGMYLDCTSTWYGVHDDYGLETPYTNKYVNCRIIGHSLVNANCIGGGCAKYSKHIIENCYFDNGYNTETAVRYHNTNTIDAEPELFISNSFFNTALRVTYYGEQTTKMRAYVNNCKAKRIYKNAESINYNVDNVNLYTWNNETDE